MNLAWCKRESFAFTIPTPKNTQNLARILLGGKKATFTNCYNYALDTRQFYMIKLAPAPGTNLAKARIVPGWAWTQKSPGGAGAGTILA
jgi:hypothetical protein